MTTSPTLRSACDALKHSPLACLLDVYLAEQGWRRQSAPWDALPRYLPPVMSPGGARTLSTAIRAQILEEMQR